MKEYPYRIHIRQGDFELDVEGDQGFVESYIEALLAEGEFVDGPRQEGGKKPARTKDEASPPQKAASGGTPEVSAGELRAFMKGKRPRGTKARYLDYLRFLKTKGVSQANEAQVRACFLAEGLTVPASGRQSFSILRREGLVKRGSRRGFWVLVEGAPTPAGKLSRKASGKRGRRRG